MKKLSVSLSDGEYRALEEYCKATRKSMYGVLKQGMYQIVFEGKEIPITKQTSTVPYSPQELDIRLKRIEEKIQEHDRVLPKLFDLITKRR